MEAKEIVDIIMPNGSKQNVFVVTYLISEDQLRRYLVYTKNEKQGASGDKVIYISRVMIDEETNVVSLESIDDVGWSEVQHLLKKIANQ